MLLLILSLMVGSLFVYISKFNFQPVSINLGLYSFSNIPLFYVMVGSMLVGLVLSYLAYLVNAIYNSLVLRGKDGEIRKNKAEALELTKRIHQLEIKNERLAKVADPENGDENAL